MVVCSALAIITPPPSEDQVGGGLTFDLTKIRSTTMARRPWYASVGFWWAVAFGGMIALVLIFSVFLK
jgi:hypothetical protein